LATKREGGSKAARKTAGSGAAGAGPRRAAAAKAAGGTTPKKSARAGAARSAPAPAPAVEPEIVEDERESGPIEPNEIEAELVEEEAAGEAKQPRTLLPLEEEEAVALEPAEAKPASSSALSRTDPLARYMHEVSRHPVLPREEEHTLAVRYRETGDLDSAYRLVASNLRLVVKIAYEYRRAAFNLLDLIQEGNVGLMHAVKKYDPYKGVKLSSYAAWWIRAYILRFVMDNWRMVKLGTTQAQRKLFFNLRKEQQKLAAEGFEAGPKLLAQRLHVSEQEVEEMDRRLSGDELSIDAPVGEDGSVTYGDRLSGAAAGAEESLGDAELKAILRRHLEKFARDLEGKERFIFENRLMSDEPLTLQEIGDKYGISRERARQIEARLVKRLRAELAAELPDFADLTVQRED
jgi:RNA polymerase sigma-32 factor